MELHAIIIWNLINKYSNCFSFFLPNYLSIFSVIVIPNYLFILTNQETVIFLTYYTFNYLKKVELLGNRKFLFHQLHN